MCHSRTGRCSVFIKNQRISRCIRLGRRGICVKKLRRSRTTWFTLWDHKIENRVLAGAAVGYFSRCPGCAGCNRPDFNSSSFPCRACHAGAARRNPRTHGQAFRRTADNLHFRRQDVFHIIPFPLTTGQDFLYIFYGLALLYACTSAKVRPHFNRQSAERTNPFEHRIERIFLKEGERTCAHDGKK